MDKLTEKQELLLKQEKQALKDGELNKNSLEWQTVYTGAYGEGIKSILSDPERWELTSIKQTAKFIKLAADKSFELVEVRQERDKLKEALESIKEEASKVNDAYIDDLFILKRLKKALTNILFLTESEGYYSADGINKLAKQALEGLN